MRSGSVGAEPGDTVGQIVSSEIVARKCRVGEVKTKASEKTEIDKEGKQERVEAGRCVTGNRRIKC